MSDSVGKISLDLEVQSDLQKQIGNISNSIGKQLKGALEGTTKSALNNMDKGVKGSLNNINSSIKSTFGKLQNNLKAMFTSLKNIKVPNNFGVPKNQTNTGENVTSNITSRGPPASREALGAKIQNVSATLDTINAKIEQQQEKLAQLRASYSQTFNQVRKNKIEEQMLKTSSAINKLIGQSDKLGFELSNLDAKYAALAVNASKVTGGTNKLSNSTKRLDHHTKKAGNSFRSSNSGLNMFIGTMFKWGIVFPLVQRGIMAMATGLLASLKTNAQFANSLAVIKTNLQVAFTPIFYAILPALNALMSALATVTTYIASFISAIFGKTYKQSYQATQGLIDAKAAMGAYGDTTEKAAKQAKKAQGILAGFDEINTLNLDNGEDDSGSGGSGGGGGANIPTLTAPDVDTSSIDSAMSRITDKFKAFINTINFEPLIRSFERLQKAVEPIVKNVGKILGWFLENILAPLAKWTIEDLIPAFFNLLAGALKVLNPILESFMKVGNWLWEHFLKPIAEWTGGIIIDVLNGLADVLSYLGEKMSEHTKITDGLTIAFTGVGIGIFAIKHPILAIILAGLWLISNWDKIKAKCEEVWGAIRAKIEEHGGGIKGFMGFLGDCIKEGWNQAWTKIDELTGGKLSAIKSKIEEHGGGFKGTMGFVGDCMKEGWRLTWNAIDEKTGGALSTIKGKIQEHGGGIKGLWGAQWDAMNSMTGGKLDAIIDRVKGWGDRIKNFFSNLHFPEIKLPHIKLPHFSMSGNFSLNPLSVPKLGVNWFAKGGIIDSPTLGVVGEAGKEAIMPLENNTGWISDLAQKVADKMPQGNYNNSNNSSSDKPVTVILKVGHTELGRVVIDSLNEIGRQNGGEIPINI